ncbi:MAG TPA: RNA polymerase factor sigma-54 [Acetobacteraceae bacterium]|nr:RNA polymerase factor sigma-54 [Acetobacteraceae bacterium]
MAIGPRIDLRQSQTLVMTPQLQQAIKLLQLSNLDVAAFVEEELERNPLLERDDAPEMPAERPAPDQLPVRAEGEADAASLVASDRLPQEAPLDADWSNTFDADGPLLGAEPGGGGGAGFDGPDRGVDDVAAGTRTLREHLDEQLRLSFGDPVDRLIGTQLIALLDGAGRVPVETDTIAAALRIDPARVAAVRARMQRFDPSGLFCRDLRECLAAQLAERNRLDPAMAALLDNLELLARRDLRGLGAVCGVDADDLADMIAEVRALDPKPAATFEVVPAQPVVPDVLMRAGPDGTWLLELNPDTLPRVLVNQRYAARVGPVLARGDRAFLAEHLANATWLVRSLQQRAQTILRVASEIVRRQDGFFHFGITHLRPLILREVAEAIEMHESTVSRVTSNKFISTPRGIFELRYFFSTAIAGTNGETHSAEVVRRRIRDLVAAEPTDEVLSDDAIVLALRREGVDIARRTVAKYRDALRIPSSVQRKREKAVPA